MVSIFIPVYNGMRFLPTTLDSILTQTYTNFEVLCVDDSSTDSSYTLLQELSHNDCRIKLFRKPNGGDVPHSWQYVIPLIQGDFVLYMSQDDRLLPDTLEQLIQRQKETGADAVIPHEIHYHEGFTLDKMHHLKGINGDTSQVITGKDAFRLMIDYSISGRALWSSDIVRRVGMTIETYNADELAQRLWVLECNTVAFSDAVFLYSHDNPDAITRKMAPHIFDDTLTNALLYHTAATNLPTETTWLQQLSGQYFHHLYLRMLQYMQQRHNYTPTERDRIKRCFQKAFLLLHREIHTKKRKYRLASTALPMMWSTVAYNYCKLKREGIILNQEMDCYSYTTI